MFRKIRTVRVYARRACFVALWVFVAVAAYASWQSAEAVERLDHRVRTLEDKPPVEINLEDGKTPRIIIHGDHRSK